MRNSLFAIATATAALLPFTVTPSSATQMQLAQADIRVDRPGVTVEERRGPGVTIEERHRRPGVVIEEGTVGRRDCRERSRTRDGVTETERECR